MRSLGSGRAGHVLTTQLFQSQAAGRGGDFSRMQPAAYPRCTRHREPRKGSGIRWRGRDGHSQFANGERGGTVKTYACEVGHGTSALDESPTGTECGVGLTDEECRAIDGAFCRAVDGDWTCDADAHELEPDEEPRPLSDFEEVELEDQELEPRELEF